MLLPIVEVKRYKVGVAFNGIGPRDRFVKIRHLFQKLDWRTDRQI